MTLRIALIDETGECEIGGVRCKVVPVEASNEMELAYYLGLHNSGTRNCYPVYRAMLSAAAIDLSGLPVVPPRSPDVASDLNYWLDAIGVPK